MAAHGDGSGMDGAAAAARRALGLMAYLAVVLLSFGWPLLTGLDASGHFDFTSYRVAALAALSPAMLAFVLAGWRRASREPWLLASLAALAWGLLVILVLAPTGDATETLLGYPRPQTADGVVPWIGAWLFLVSSWLLVSGKDAESRRRRDTVVLAALVGGTLAALFVGFEFARLAVLNGIVRAFTARPSGTTPNAVAYASMALVLAGTAFWTLRRERGSAKAFSRIALVATVASVVLSAGRAGTLALLPLSGWGTADALRHGRRRQAVLIVVGTLAVLALVFGLRPIGQVTETAAEARATMNGGEQTALNGRELLWKQGAQLVREKPLGWGITWHSMDYDGVSAEASMQYRGLGILRAHNAILDILIIGGIPGLLLISLVMFQRLRKLGQREAETWAVSLGMLAISWLTYHPDLYSIVPTLLLLALLEKPE